MISSKDNPQVKALNKLIHQPKRNDMRMAVEGVHACQLLLDHQAQHGLIIEKIWVGESALANPEIQELLAQAARQSIAVVQLANGVFRTISSLEQGVSIIFEVQRPQLRSVDGYDASGNFVLLDGVQDPGNLGSILRSAAAAGIHEVWLSPACVNPYSAKVLRAGVGAHFGIRIRENIDLTEAVKSLQSQGVTVCATSSHTEQSIYRCQLNRPIAWLMGNEGAGLSADLLPLSDEQVTIPMQVGESLNVAAASAVCMFEMLRQQTQ